MNIMTGIGELSEKEVPMKSTLKLRALAGLLALTTLLPLAACTGDPPDTETTEDTTAAITSSSETEPDESEESSSRPDETKPNETTPDETEPVEPEPSETRPDGNGSDDSGSTDSGKAGIPLTDYLCAQYADLLENGYAKMEGDGASVTVDGIDGGKGGFTSVTMTYCSEPNLETTFEIEVNGEVQHTFKNQGGNGWFEMRKETFKVKLNPGAENAIRIINKVGRISHIAVLTVGDVDMRQETIKDIKKNGTTYKFTDGNPPETEASGGKTYAKLNLSNSVTLTGIDGGEGGLCAAYIRCTTQPGVSTSLRVSVNGNVSVVLPVADISNGWFQFFESVFNTYLNPGTDNTVTVQVVEGGITHFDILAVGKTDGSSNNPYLPVTGDVVGKEDAALDGAVDFLTSKGILKNDDDTAKAATISVLTSMVGADHANTLWNQFSGGGEGTQKQFLTMLLHAMGYETVTTETAVKKAEVLGIVGNISTGSFGDASLTVDGVAAYTYNALSALCADGKTLADKCGVELTAPDSYEVTLVPQDTSSTAEGSTATVVSGGGTGIVTTADRYRRFTITAKVKADMQNGFTMGFRLDSGSHGMYDSGVWLRFSNQNVHMIAYGHTAYAEVPMGLFNTTDGMTLKVVDNGQSINLYSVIGSAEIPFIEIRFVDGYAVLYVRGHLIHGLDASKLCDAGHIAFGSSEGKVVYSDITVTDADPVQNLNTEFPAISEGEDFTAIEDFSDGIYDYNLFFGTGGGLSVKDGKLVFTGIGRENIFSTVMRVEDGVLEADVLPGSGDMQFQIGASSSMSEGYYYCGLRFTVKSGSVELYHNTGNMDEEATTDTLTRAHSFNTSQGYRIRLADRDGEITFGMKGHGDSDYTVILRLVRKDDYFSVLDRGGVFEEAHFDGLQREFGYLRIVSDRNAAVDNVVISGKAYLPYEQMEIRPAPAPDEGKMLEADDVETLVGIGYIPYFTRYKANGVNATRPAVEDLLPSVIAASKLRGDERTAALNKLYWGYAWWATPAQGMYCGRDAWAAKTNLQKIAEAGIDFIYIDNTNFNGGCTPDSIMNNLEVILEAALELEAEGKPYPKICFWNNVRNEAGWERGGYEDTAREIWQVFISNPRYRNLWVYYHGKPLMMYTFGQSAPYLGMSEVAEIREMWTASNVRNTWSFHQDPPEMANRGGLDAEGNLEQLNVLPYGKTTFNGNISSLEGLVENGTGGREGGLYYKKYWQTAFEKRPKFVMIWAYNHWDVNFNKPGADGNVYWGDNFSQEYSGGIEPIAGTFTYKGVEYAGDSYYEWTKEYVRSYKAGEDMPEDLYAK